MARGKFNKRGGGKRVDAQSADEIEQRNERLAEFEANREKRRAEAAEEEAGGGGEGGGEGAADDEEKGDSGGGRGRGGGGNADAEGATPDGKPVIVTSEADHRRNRAKLEAVRARRAVAEEKRKALEDEEKLKEAEAKMQAAAIIQDDSDSDDDGKKKKKKSKAKIIPKLSKIDIKKMKPTQMKEALKERELDIQGNAKILTKRLLDYEAAR